MSGYRVTLPGDVDVAIEKLIARPSVSLLQKGFEYTRAAETDIRVTFARIKAQQQKQQRLHTVERKTRA